MTTDSMGFSYPAVDPTACSECSACSRVCNFSEGYTTAPAIAHPDVYGIRIKDDSILRKSQSGGAFSVFADPFIKKGGLVYGATLTDNFTVRHIAADCSTGLSRLHGSKYVQSDINGIFRKIITGLKEGKKILFVGTPCQVSGLKSFIPKSLSDNLYTIDLICHGVGSPKVWQDYIRYLHNRYSRNIVKADFRDKKFGWHIAKETYALSDSSEKVRKTYLKLYFSRLIHRESCYSCPFTNLRRVGDVTIGDFWGWEKSHAELNDEKGVSLVLINTEKGRKWFDHVKDLAITIKSDLSECLQQGLEHPVTPDPRRDEFLDSYSRHNFKYIATHYGDVGMKYHLNQFITRVRGRLKI